MKSVQQNYILSNETIAVGIYTTIYYNGKNHELNECPITGVQSFTDETGTELKVIGFLEYHHDGFIRIYAETQDEYDTIMNTISVTDPNALESAYYTFNDLVFVYDPQPQIEWRYNYWTFIDECSKLGFETLSDCKTWANGILEKQ